MDVARRKAVKGFAEHWLAYTGNEIQGTAQFWIEFARDVLAAPEPTRVFEFERRVRGRRIDAFIEDTGVLIEQKAPGTDLDKPEERGKDEGGDKRMVTPFEQARWYAEKLPYSIRPRWVLTCNFQAIRIYDMNEERPEDAYVEVPLGELPQRADLFGFMTSGANSRLELERALSVQAGELVARLRDALAAQYRSIETDEREQRSLNMLVTRLVFLLYAEDAGLLQERQAFQKYLRAIPTPQLRGALVALFRMLDTPEDARDPYADPALLAFPYVNGGLFSDEDVVVPQLTEDIRQALLDEASAGFDWSGISPTIFGAAFESSLNPETRRAGGMHYTSVENIHKVIDPLFLDGLRAELAQIEGEKVERRRVARLRQFQLKLSRLAFLDPAMGSGNFLTETYLSLRRLELRVIEDVQGDQTSMGLDVENPVMVNIGQFYGIEVNDFAVSVAKTALWIAEQQMLERTQELLPYEDFDFLPLKSIDGLHEGNALRMDWNDVLPAERCSYVIGNPPFVGHQWRSKAQQDDMDAVFSGKVDGYGKLDYVCAWYERAAEYVRGTAAGCALVATNSICQGESVGLLWRHMARMGMRIDFAWRPFVWNNEATDQAHVHVVVVGFSDSASEGRGERVVYDGSSKVEASHINGYLFDAPDVFIENRGRPVNEGAPEMTKGSQPTDGGSLVLSEQERRELLAAHPDLDAWIRPYMGGKEFLNGGERYCLWLVGAGPQILAYPEIMARLDAVRAAREKSPTASVREAAATPWLFTQIRQPTSHYLAVPEVSSGRRRYLSLGYVGPDVVASNKLRFIPSDSLYLFGLLSSLMHAAWMRVVAGRLKSDYSYSPAVYNSFVWPDCDDAARESVRGTARAVLDARAAHPEATLAQLYDPEGMPPDLRAAHEANDAAVETAYGVDFGDDEGRIVAHLFRLYAEKAGASRG